MGYQMDDLRDSRRDMQMGDSMVDSRDLQMAHRKDVRRGRLTDTLMAPQ